MFHNEWIIKDVSENGQTWHVHHKMTNQHLQHCAPDLHTHTHTLRDAKNANWPVPLFQYPNSPSEPNQKRLLVWDFLRANVTHPFTDSSCSSQTETIWSLVLGHNFTPFERSHFWLYGIVGATFAHAVTWVHVFLWSAVQENTTRKLQWFI